MAIDSNGRVCVVTLSVGGLLGMGGKHVAIPWDALKFSVGGDKGDKRRITLSVTNEQLEEAPEYTKNKDGNEDMCDPTWIGRVYEFSSVPTCRGAMDTVETKTKPKN